MKPELYHHASCACKDCSGIPVTQTILDAEKKLHRENVFFSEVHAELQNAQKHYPKFNSAHEGFAVLKEEIDELWDEVKKKQSNPDRNEKMRKEAIQVAAMAMRFLNDCT